MKRAIIFENAKLFLSFDAINSSANSVAPCIAKDILRFALGQ